MKRLRKLPKSQTKLESFVEACIGIAIGYVLAVCTQIVVFPIFGVETTLNQQLMIGLAMTGMSITRTYFLRRFFNHLHKTGKMRRLLYERKIKNRD